MVALRAAERAIGLSRTPLIQYRDKKGSLYSMLTKGRELGFVLCLGTLAFHGLPLNAQLPGKPSSSEQARVLSTREQAETVLALIKDPNPESSLKGKIALRQFATLDLKLELLGDSNSLVRMEALRSINELLTRSPMKHTFGLPTQSARGNKSRSRQAVQFSSESYTENVSSRVPKIKEGLERLDKSDKEIAELAASCLALIDRNEDFKGITLAKGVIAAKKEPPEGKLEIQKGMLVLLASDGKQIAEFGRFYGPVNCWALHSNNRWLAIGCGDTSAGEKDRGGGYTKVGFIEIYDLKTKQKVEHIHGANHFWPVTQIGFDGDRLLYVAGDYEQSGAK